MICLLSVRKHLEWQRHKPPASTPLACSLLATLDECAGHALQQRVGSCHGYLEVSFGITDVDSWCYLECYLVLPGVLPGVTWRYLVLPGVTWALPSVTWVFILECFFFVVPKYPRFSNSNFWKKINSQLCCVEGEEERGWKMSIDHKTKKPHDKRQ